MKIEDLVNEFEAKWKQKLGKYDEESQANFYQFLKFTKRLAGDLNALVCEGISLDKSDYPFERALG